MALIARRGQVGAVAMLAVALGTREASAGRPLLTDDAAVVGHRVVQLEAWLRADEDVATQHAVVAYGPLAPLEVSLSAVHGLDLEESRYVANGPTLQLKSLAFEPVPAGAPGIAVAAGATAPYGLGRIKPDGWSAYGYVAASLVPGRSESLRLHANAGMIVHPIGVEDRTALTFGLGADLALSEELRAFAEIVSGDPATDDLDGVAHGGLKYSPSSTFHVDMTVGGGVWGESRVGAFATAGVRWATE